MNATDLIVVGGGIIGLSIAREAARSGLTVRLLDQGHPGGAASPAAAGLIGAQLEAEGPGPLLDLALLSRDLYPSFVNEVAGEADVDLRIGGHGCLLVARTPTGLAGLDRRVAFQLSSGLAAERLDRQGVHALEPGLAPEVEGGLYLPRDRTVDPVLLLRGLRAAALRAGVEVRNGIAATRLIVDADRVVGVESGAGRLPSGTVLIAAGAWSGALQGEGGASPPSVPVKGQILCLLPDRPPLRHAVMDEDHRYLVPRPDGRVLVGSTMERVGFDTTVTAGGLAQLAAAAVGIAPALAAAPFHSAWAGLRPAGGDELPVIGRGSLRGLMYSYGHLRNGILLAPITARLAVALLRGDAPPLDPRPFDPLRFGRGSPVREGGR
jgi:glycine oxidase